jgi:hypothetical protein
VRLESQSKHPGPKTRCPELVEAVLRDPSGEIGKPAAVDILTYSSPHGSDRNLPLVLTYPPRCSIVPNIRPARPQGYRPDCRRVVAEKVSAIMANLEARARREG